MLTPDTSRMGPTYRTTLDRGSASLDPESRVTRGRGTPRQRPSSRDRSPGRPRRPCGGVATGRRRFDMAPRSRLARGAPGGIVHPDTIISIRASTKSSATGARCSRTCLRHAPGGSAPSWDRRGRAAVLLGTSSACSARPARGLDRRWRRCATMRAADLVRVRRQLPASSCRARAVRLPRPLRRHLAFPLHQRHQQDEEESDRIVLDSATWSGSSTTWKKFPGEVSGGMKKAGEAWPGPWRWTRCITCSTSPTPASTSHVGELLPRRAGQEPYQGRPGRLLHRCRPQHPLGHARAADVGVRRSTRAA